MKLTQAQFLALRDFVDHVCETNCGPKAYKGHESSSPRSDQVGTYRALAKAGLIDLDGRAHEHSAGVFSWKVLSFRLTAAGRQAIMFAMADAKAAS